LSELPVPDLNYPDALDPNGGAARGKRTGPGRTKTPAGTFTSEAQRPARRRIPVMHNEEKGGRSAAVVHALGAKTPA
jgi:hypothetical protein